LVFVKQAVGEFSNLEILIDSSFRARTIELNNFHSLDASKTTTTTCTHSLSKVCSLAWVPLTLKLVIGRVSSPYLSVDDTLPPPKSHQQSCQRTQRSTELSLAIAFQHTPIKFLSHALGALKDVWRLCMPPVCHIEFCTLILGLLLILRKPSRCAEIQAHRVADGQGVGYLYLTFGDVV